MAFKGKETIRTKNALVEINTAKLAKLVDPKRVVNKAVRADLARKIKAESLALVAAGKSPVRGEGRFKAYAAQRNTRKAPKPRSKRSISLGRRVKRAIAAVKKFLSNSPSRRPKPAGAKELSGFYPEIAALLRKWPQKKTRPVNLALDPKKPYLNSLFDYKPVDGGIKFQEPSDPFLNLLYLTHNEGSHKHVPQRKVVPSGRDDYVSGIRKIIKNIYSRRIRSIIKGNG
jgi:hypothetical protein